MNNLEPGKNYSLAVSYTRNRNEQIIENYYFLSLPDKNLKIRLAFNSVDS